MQRFVETLLACSEAAANIARACRSEEALFHLMVEEKVGEERQKLATADFRTVADVLVQVAVKKRIIQEYPELEGHVLGEEDDTLTVKGQKVPIHLSESKADTHQMLSLILDKNEHSATALTAAIHQPISIETDARLKDIGCLDVNPEDLAIWIDPIDNTGAYVAGCTGTLTKTGVYSNGLQCITVIIGVFDRSTGMPVVGVLNQPFHQHLETRWLGKCVWGVAYESCFCNSLGTGISQRSESQLSSDSEALKDLVVVVSSSELTSIVSALSDHGLMVQPASGAGYKLLCVIEQLACAYLVSKSSTFKWDTCGPHAILCSMGGNVVSLKNVGQKGDQVIQYRHVDVRGLAAGQMWRNDGGLLAFGKRPVQQIILDAIQTAVDYTCT
jgi:inositol polyphosphate 1-phosphatase